MVQVTIDLKKSVDENAGVYFDKAKKLKKKLEGALETVARYQKQLKELESKQEFYEKQEAALEKKKAISEARSEWYHKYHWFISSEGLVCIGGRDATQNEILVKKHMEKNDWVLHTDMAGSPFFLVKDGQVKGSEISIEECAQAVACHSRGWKQGLGTVDVFYVKPEQVTKEAQSGENLPKGAFMVRGETKYFHPELAFAFASEIQTVSLEDGESSEVEVIIWGPKLAIEKRVGSDSEGLFVLVPGREKKSALAKTIVHSLGVGLVDDVVAAMPAGGADIKGKKGRKSKGKKKKK